MGKPSTPLVITRDEIRAIYRQGEDAVIALVESLVERINQLEARVEALENQVSKTSRNSSKPPSGDGFGKRTRSLRTPSSRKSGGQPEHPGSTLEFSEVVDYEVQHQVHECAGCGVSLRSVSVAEIVRHQVYDLPMLSLEVTEHQAEVKSCPHCGLENRASFPFVAKHPVQYGPVMKGLTVYLMERQLLPSARTCELLSEVLGADLSEGTLFNYRNECAEALSPITEQIETAIQQAPVAHFDETGLRVKGQTQWLHVASTNQLTAYHVDPKRGQAGMNAMGILPKFKGKAIHDNYQSYPGYDCHHFLCNAHHLRELQFVWERYEQPWAVQMLILLSTSNQMVIAAKQDHQANLDPEQLQLITARYAAILEQGFLAQPPPTEPDPDQPKPRGRPKQSIPKNLLDRLQKKQSEVLGFVHDFEVPFDNNQAERDLRMMKLKVKISGGFRSEKGAAQFCDIRSYMSTLRKQGMDLFDALVCLFMGTPISPSFTAE